MDYEIETLGEGEVSIGMEQTEILKRFIGSRLQQRGRAVRFQGSRKRSFEDCGEAARLQCT